VHFLWSSGWSEISTSTPSLMSFCCVSRPSHRCSSITARRSPLSSRSSRRQSRCLNSPTWRGSNMQGGCLSPAVPLKMRTDDMGPIWMVHGSPHRARALRRRYSRRSTHDLPVDSLRSNGPSRQVRSPTNPGLAAERTGPLRANRDDVSGDEHTLEGAAPSRRWKGGGN
jgi:hypothetical protein